MFRTWEAPSITTPILLDTPVPTATSTAEDTSQATEEPLLPPETDFGRSLPIPGNPGILPEEFRTPSTPGPTSLVDSGGLNPDEPDVHDDPVDVVVEETAVPVTENDGNNNGGNNDEALIAELEGEAVIDDGQDVPEINEAINDQQDEQTSPNDTGPRMQMPPPESTESDDGTLSGGEDSIIGPGLPDVSRGLSAGGSAVIGNLPAKAASAPGNGSPMKPQAEDPTDETVCCQLYTHCDALIFPCREPMTFILKFEMIRYHGREPG